MKIHDQETLYKSNNPSNSSWTQDEDTRLLLLLDKYETNWNKIRISLPNKSVSQLSERSSYLINSVLNSKVWSTKEDQYLLQLGSQCLINEKMKNKMEQIFDCYYYMFALKHRIVYLNKLNNTRNSIIKNTSYNNIISNNSKIINLLNLNKDEDKMKKSSGIKDNKDFIVNIRTNYNRDNINNNELTLHEEQDDELSKKDYSNQEYSNSSSNNNINNYSLYNRNYNDEESISNTNEIKSKYNSKRPFIINKIPKCIKFSYILRNNMKKLKEQNQNLVKINAHLIKIMSEMIFNTRLSRNKNNSGNNSKEFNLNKDINKDLNCMINSNSNKKNINNEGNSKETDFKNISINNNIFNMLFKDIDVEEMKKKIQNLGGVTAIRNNNIIYNTYTNKSINEVIDKNFDKDKSNANNNNARNVCNINIEKTYINPNNNTYNNILSALNSNYSSNNGNKLTMKITDSSNNNINNETKHISKEESSITLLNEN